MPARSAPVPPASPGSGAPWNLPLLLAFSSPGVAAAAGDAPLLAAPLFASPLLVPFGLTLGLAGALGGWVWHLYRQRGKGPAPVPHQDALSAAIVRASSDAIFTMDASGAIHSLNPAAAAQFGYEIEELRGKNIAALIPPPARGRRRSNYITSGANRDLYGVRRDGTRFPVEVKLDELTFSNWRLIALSVRDITERREAELTAERQAAELEAIFEHAGALLLVLAPDGHIQRWNRAAESLLDYSEGEVRGQMVWEILPNLAEMEEFGRRMRQLLEGPFPARAEMNWAARSGKLFHMSCVLTATLTPDGHVDRVLLAAFDISARRGYETRHLRSERMAAVSRLAGGVAHDFNNLLTAITGYSGLVLQGLEERSPIRKDVEEIKRAGDRGAAITRQLLALSGRHPRKPQLLDLNECLANCDRMLRVVTGEPVALELQPGARVAPVTADLAQIEEMILHLASFAREQMPQGGRLRIETSNETIEKTNPEAEPPLAPGAYAVLTFTDTSHGLSDEAIAHLFEPFYPPNEFGGKTNNLGLATVAGVVRQNGGSILVSAVRGAGNTIRVYLPQAERPVFLTPERANPHLFVVPKPRDLSGTETVLVAFEQDARRAALRAVLEPAGYKLLEARSGLQAMEIAHKLAEPIHLLLTDVSLPRMSGPDLLSSLLATRPQLRVLYASSRPTDEVTAQGLSPDAVFPLLAGFTRESLLERVRETLDGHSLSVGG